MEAKITEKGCPQINAEPNRKNAAFIRRLSVRENASFGRSENNGYVTNHNMITMAMVIFKTYKMADKGEERVLTEILVYSCFIEPFICLLLTMNWEVP